MRPKTAVIMRNGPPGPGSYTPSKKTVHLRPPSAVIGHSTREGGFGEAKGIPGPGSYMTLQSGKKGPLYSFGTAKGLYSKVDGPGPGAYRIPCTFASLPHYLLTGKSTEYEKI